MPKMQAGNRFGSRDKKRVHKNPEDPEFTERLSALMDGASLRWKAPGICETTSGVTNISGYVKLAPGILHELGIEQNYTSNTFFWYFASRRDPKNDPLAIWLTGGPGSSSLMSVLSEHGPCQVNIDSATTTPNSWSFNAVSNMLYIDQPVQTGFSYATESGSGNSSNVSHSTAHTSYSSEVVAESLWIFMQVWLKDFTPHQGPRDMVNIWTQSYGGHYSPKIAKVFRQKNDLISKGYSPLKFSSKIGIRSLGILNGCIDTLIQAPSYLEMSRGSNSFNASFIGDESYWRGLTDLHQPGGCIDKIHACRRMVAAVYTSIRNSGTGPTTPFSSRNKTVERACHQANTICGKHISVPIAETGRSLLDIAQPKENQFPPSYFLGYLAQKTVREALGVDTFVPFTVTSAAVMKAFAQYGDNVRGGYIESLAEEVKSGTHLALVYGDRDLACNGVGGERISTEISHRIWPLSPSSSSHLPPFFPASPFEQMSYEPFKLDEVDERIKQGTVTEPSSTLVRQLGYLSFTLVGNAGHQLAAFQPQLAQAIFKRVLDGFDVATGKKPTVPLSVVSSNSEHLVNSTEFNQSVNSSPIDTTIAKNPATPSQLGWQQYRQGLGKVARATLPPAPEITCYALDLGGCTAEQQAAVRQYYSKTDSAAGMSLDVHKDMDSTQISSYFLLSFPNGTCSPNPIAACDGADERFWDTVPALGGRGKKDGSDEENGDQGEYGALIIIVISLLICLSILVASRELKIFRTRERSKGRTINVHMLHD